MTTATTRRRGVSLIELLVVVALIGLLSALSAGAVIRLRAAQDQNNAEGTLSKVHSNLQSRWSAVLDQAKKDVPQALVDGLAEGDKDRAIAIWSYAKLQNEFPQNFVEATRNINFGVGAILTPRKVFETIATNPANASLTPEEQSAVLICAALSSTGTSGNAMGTDGIQNQMSPIGTGNVGPNCFKDSWGNPIVFVRHAGENPRNAEIDSEPFLRAVTVKNASLATPPVITDFVVHNPLDPTGKLVNRTGNTWTFPNKKTTLGQLGYKGFTQFPNFNFVPTLISAGKNKKLGTATTMIAGGDDDANDNILSFRLRREGDRGN